MALRRSRIQELEIQDATNVSSIKKWKQLLAVAQNLKYLRANGNIPSEGFIEDILGKVFIT